MYKLIVSLLISVTGASALAADMNEPFDFSYSVDGRNSRPVNVFNDGEVTYIQGREKQQLFIDGQNVSMRGPYYIVKGVPDTIVGYAGGEPFKIVWLGENRSAISNEVDRKNGDFKEKTFSGTFGRIAFVNGVPPDVGLVNPLPKNLQLKEAMKALAPQGWSGAADKSINTTQNISIESSSGESWVTVLDRMMTRLNIWVEMDSGKKNLFLRDSPPKGFSVVLESNSQPRMPSPVTVTKAATSNTFTPGSSVSKQVVPVSDELLTMVNVSSIKQKNGQTIISLLNSAKTMRFYNVETGVDLHPVSVNNVELALPILPLIRIQVDGGDAIDVKRIFKHDANFSIQNPIGLKHVGEADGLTVFSFDGQLPNLTAMTADNRSLNGTWSNNQFIVQGTSPEWKLTTPESALAVDIVDKGVYVWKRAFSE